jgi:hypothetical protein
MKKYVLANVISQMTQSKTRAIETPATHVVRLLPALRCGIAVV